jgi:hypothetical protein
MQANLFERGKVLTIEERFDVWLKDNPQIYPLFLQFAREVRARRRHYSIDAITQRVRWHVNIETRGDDAADFKINDHFRSRLARKLMMENPELADMFELRRIRTK